MIEHHIDWPPRICNFPFIKIVYGMRISLYHYFSSPDSVPKSMSFISLCLIIFLLSIPSHEFPDKELEVIFTQAQNTFLHGDAFSLNGVYNREVSLCYQSLLPTFAG